MDIVKYTGIRIGQIVTNMMTNCTVYEKNTLIRKANVKKKIG